MIFRLGGCGEGQGVVKGSVIHIDTFEADCAAILR